MARAKPAPFPGPLPPLPTIPPEERTPLVNVLLALLEHYRATDEQQSERRYAQHGGVIRGSLAR